MSPAARSRPATGRTPNSSWTLPVAAHRSPLITVPPSFTVTPVLPHVTDDRGEHSLSRRQLAEHRESQARLSLYWRHRRDLHQRAGIADREIAQHESVEQAEDGGVCADREGERDRPRRARIPEFGDRRARRSERPATGHPKRASRPHRDRLHASGRCRRSCEWRHCEPRRAACLERCSRSWPFPGGARFPPPGGRPATACGTTTPHD